MAKNQAVMVKLAERNVEASMKRLADAVKERKVQEKVPKMKTSKKEKNRKNVLNPV